MMRGLGQSIVARLSIAAAIVCGASIFIPSEVRGADQAADVGAPPRPVIERDPQSLVTRVVIEARSGRVAWSDILAGIAEAKGYDATAFAELLKDRSLAIDRTSTQLQVVALNVILPPGMRIAVLPPGGAAVEPSLEVVLDRAALLASKRRFTNLLRAGLVDRVGSSVNKRAYGLQWETPVDAAAVAAGEAIVVVHGYQSAPEKHSSLTEDLKTLGKPVASFRYPADQSIDDSARLLSAELRKLTAERPRQRLRIVGLSMGGLIARRAIEDPQLDPGNVRQLVMIATPNHGSQLAEFGFALEVWQFLGDMRTRGVAQTFYETIEDGLGEAADDLCPESLLLRKLNARPRNPDVRYAVLLGTGGPMSGESLAEMRRRLSVAGEKNRFVRFFGTKLDQYLADCDEMVSGRGDGAVSVARGRLEGVEDIVTLDFNHSAISHAPRSEGERQLRAAIIERVNSPLP